MLERLPTQVNSDLGDLLPHRWEACDHIGLTTSSASGTRPLMTCKFVPGDRVIKNDATWIPNDFDSWGRGIGVGVVVQAPFTLVDLGQVDVRWPAGRCFEHVDGLLPAAEGGAE